MKKQVFFFVIYFILCAFQNINAQCSPDITAPLPDITTLPDLVDECYINAVAPTATDNCAGSIQATTTDPVIYNVEGTYTVTWTYNDGNGNTSTQTQKISIDDITAPVSDLNSLPDLTDECSVTVSTSPTATDNCVGSVAGTTSDPLTYTTEGNYMITWTYDDGKGNTSIQLQNVFIDDITDPVPDATTLPDVKGVCSVTVLTAPTATDNCAGVITGITADPFVYNTEGVYVITWSYDDGNGNTKTQTQNVNVVPVDTSVTVNMNTLTANNISSGITYQWVDCNNGDSPISGEINQSFSPVADGSYAVEVTENGCTAISSCYTIISTGIVLKTEGSLTSVYPNPTNGLINIDLHEKKEGEIVIRDILGQVIEVQNIKSGQISIDLYGQPNGIYFISIETASSNRFFKISKY
jgi:hypothetical protein